MSHSKLTKRGYSLYIEKWNCPAKKYINTCILCGRQGYSPVIEDKDFCSTLENKVIYKELKRILRQSSAASDVYKRQGVKFVGRYKTGNE